MSSWHRWRICDLSCLRVRTSLALYVLLAFVGTGMSARAACGVDNTPDRIAVADISTLQTAIDAACPGNTIAIAPGRYSGRLRVGAHVAGTPERPITIAAAAGLGSVIIDGNGTDIVLKFSGASHVELRGLEITGGGYHGVFFDRGAHHITIAGNRVHDNHRARPLDSHAEIKGSGGDNPHHIVIRGNDIFHESHPPGSNFQGIDCNFCDDFHIVGNHIHDINRPTGQAYSYYDRGSCIQMKSRSRRTLIENNRIERCQFGIVLGGEGMASPENIGGIVRNNIVRDSVEYDLAVVYAHGAIIVHNTLLGPGLLLGTDVRFADSSNSGRIANNLLAAPVAGVLGPGVAVEGNLVLPGLTTAALFRAAAAGDFRLAPGAPSLDMGTVDLGDATPRTDYRGRARQRAKLPNAGAVVRGDEP